MSRVLIVSNRLPVTVRADADGVEVQPSVGGVATGLRGPHERSGGLWIGWPGLMDPLPEKDGPELAAKLEAMRLVQVALTREEVHRYYEAYSNGVLWPLFHYFASELPLEIEGFEEYERVNRRFAEAVIAHHQPGDLVWVQDYQLMRVPALIRTRLPEARIGFFLHIPFPSSETFRTLPQREQILEGLLGADVLGFHTAAYVRHFSSSVLRTTGAWTDVDRIPWRGREVRLGVFPMGVDAASWRELAGDPGVVEEMKTLRAGSQRLLVGIDRLDYTKGIPRRLLAYEQLLLRHPELCEHVRLVQVAVPSRTGVGAYQGVRETVDALVGRINGRFATPNWSPVRYLARGLSPPEVTALYRAADVLVVTPIRDGMNLVAKEFIAARTDGDGVLVLSEFTGAAAELAEALLVNPYDVDGTAEALWRALQMPAEERHIRMTALRARVETYDVHRWSREFLDRLGSDLEPPHALRPSTPSALAAAQARIRAAPSATLLIDYDGTMVEFAPTPDLAVPDSGLLALLEALARRYVVHVVSGRRRDTLERWLGALPIGLHAEHGYWSRMPGGHWHGAIIDPSSWLPQVRSILEEYAARTPGALVEEKTAGLAWHHRAADPEFGAAQAGDLLLHLATLLSNAPAEVLTGDHVVEIRPQGVNKGQVVQAVVAHAPRGTLVAALGDDRTDEDLFAAVPPGSISIHVGPAASRAELRVRNVTEARAFLRGLLDPSS
ncbi:MAG TPA: bifunctional alpha,alpha-trehalose-phosphate synthase (UDP-forming)/trehalose-phosphatase [Myxococcaceae bacterium]|nr:bifunctional alpha,alpha-trehalose-phosphate synthase (UDP-forming)/trehalose-phosphatase [Myxococcaceae bacterium]